MVSQEDHERLAQATELLKMVMERHRHEDMRVLTLLTSAIRDICVGERYLDSIPSTPLR
ncbi:MAG: hypothetical protein ACRDSE_18085 [Pseudonocardiaceae bacterium]